MKHLLQQLIDIQKKPIGTILFAGAGTGAELDCLRQFNARRLVLLEPNPKLALSLHNKLLADRGEELLEAGLVPKDGHWLLHILNNSRESSFISATGLTDYFPNLREVRQIEVECQTLSNLMVRFDINADAENVLILEVPGLEGPLLANTNAGVLQAFSNIIVRTSEEALYGNESHKQAVCDRLAEVGFKLEGVDPDSLSPYTALLFQRDDEAVNRQHLTLQVQSQAELIQSLQKQFDALEASHKELRQENEALIQKHVMEIESLEADRDAHAKLAEERMAKIEALKKTGDEQARHASELRSQTEQAQGARDEQVKLVLQRQASINTLKEEKVKLAADRDEKARLADQRQAELVALGQAKEEQAKLNAELQAQIKQLMQDRDQQAKLALDCQKNVEALKKEKAELSINLDAQTTLADQRQTEIDALLKANADLTELSAERQGQIQQLAQTRDEQAKLAVDRGTQLEGLKKEKAKLEAERDATEKLVEQRQVEIEALRKAKDEHAKLAAERQAQLQQMTQARDEQAALATKRQAGLDALHKEKEELEADRNAKATLATDCKGLVESRNAELKKANSLLNEKASRIADLEAQLADFEFRQSLLNQEMIKTEAQIGLIKDVLLREPGI